MFEDPIKNVESEKIIPSPLEVITYGDIVIERYNPSWEGSDQEFPVEVQKIVNFLNKPIIFFQGLENEKGKSRDINTFLSAENNDLYQQSNESALKIMY